MNLDDQVYELVKERPGISKLGLALDCFSEDLPLAACYGMAVEATKRLRKAKRIEYSNGWHAIEETRDAD